MAVREAPAAPPQRRLWAIEQEMPGSTQHNLTLEIVQPETLAPLPSAPRSAMCWTATRRCGPTSG